ncbi:MAG: segregation and condensation protein B [Crocinitomicaceae bacterium]|jgi:segregation and condensation protein B
MNTHQQKIESLLFYKNEPLSYSWLAKKLEVSESHIRDNVRDMAGFYVNRGFVLIETKDNISLMTSEVSREIIQNLSKVGEERDLSKQALETLAIIIYKESVTKSQIDFIRGVNSVFILRNLLIRGLISKKQNLLDKRSPYYIPTHDLFSFLGVQSSEQLPEREAIHKKLEALHNDFQEEENSFKKEPIIVNGDNE